MLLSGVQAITGLFFTWKALHIYPRDPRGENIPFQEVAEAKLHLLPHVRAKTPPAIPWQGQSLWIPTPGVLWEHRGFRKNTGWVLAAVTAEGCQEIPFPSQHGQVEGMEAKLSLSHSSQIPNPSLTAPKHVRKQNSFGQAGLKHWEWRKGTIKPWWQRKGH